MASFEFWTPCCKTFTAPIDKNHSWQSHHCHSPNSLSGCLESPVSFKLSGLWYPGRFSGLTLSISLFSRSSKNLERNKQTVKWPGCSKKKKKEMWHCLCLVANYVSCYVFIKLLVCQRVQAANSVSKPPPTGLFSWCLGITTFAWIISALIARLIFGANAPPVLILAWIN